MTLRRSNGVAFLLRVSFVALSINGLLASGFLASVERASAQSWLSDRSRAQGSGIRLGDFELHPGIGIEVGYDSNLYLTQDTPSAVSRRVDTGILRVTPHLYLSTLSDERRQEGESGDGNSDSLPTADFRAGISASYYEFFADERRRNVDVSGDFRLSLLPGRSFSLTVGDVFTRSVRPFTENFSSAQSMARISNNANIDLYARTTGSILEFRLGYQFGLDYFEGEIFQYANNFQHTFSLQETFRFLPNTGLVHVTDVTIGDYWDTNRADARVLLSDNVRVRTKIGLNGAISNQISVMGLIGYAAGFFQSPIPGYKQDFDSIIGQLEGRWAITEAMNLRLGFERDFAQAFIGNYSNRNRGYIGYQAMIAGSFLLAADVDLALVEYGAIVDREGMTLGNTQGRQDVRFGGSLYGEYRFVDWLALNATVRYTGVFTDYQYGISSATLLDPAGYSKFEVFGGVRAFL